LHENFLHMLPTLGAINSKPNECKKSTKWQNKNHFPCSAFRMDFVAFKILCITYYFIKCIIWTFPNIDVCMTYPWKKIEIKCIVKTFFLIHLNWKLRLRQGLRLFKRTQRTSILYLIYSWIFFIRLIWHHFSYCHTPNHYNHVIPKPSHFLFKTLAYIDNGDLPFQQHLLVVCEPLPNPIWTCLNPFKQLVANHFQHL
jgi:hypothetical protein